MKILPVISYRDCVGCEACAALCPETFEMRDDKAWVKDYDSFNPDTCRSLLSVCPSGAITFEEHEDPEH